MENRWHERKPVRINALINSNNMMINGITENIGIGGLYLTIAPGIYLQNKQSVKLSLLNKNTLIPVQAKVVRIETNKIALQFSYYSPESLILLKQLLNEENHLN
ncbi:MAG: PilZ domain-containing protein [Gammaproteobacteria bacterium]|nr:PilZ domain-containing protein [Gammaproteobacteria bacterium]